jgi:DNA-binding response OmpR family regulator
MKKKILIVEDNNDSREIMALFITKMGYQPIKAKNSNEAIALAAGEGPDLISEPVNEMRHARLRN